MYSVFLIIFIFVICEANKQNKQSLKGKQNFLVPDYYNTIKINEYRKRIAYKNCNFSSDYYKYLKDNQIPDSLSSYRLFLKNKNAIDSFESNHK